MDQYLNLYSLSCETLLDPYREIKALGRWIKFYSIGGSLRVTQPTRLGFEICLSKSLHTASKVKRTFQIHIDVFGQLAQLFAIPLPASPRDGLHSQHGTNQPKSGPSREPGNAIVIEALVFPHSLKTQILEDCYQSFLSKQRITPTGHGQGCASERTPQNGAEAPTTTHSDSSARTACISAAVAGVRSNDNDNDSDEDATVSRKRIRKTADEKEAELRCPEAAAGRGYAKCLTYSTRQVHRLKSDHLMPDHQFQRHMLEIGRGKRREAEEHKWVRLFLKLNPDWNTNPPSPYYSTNYQTLHDFGTFLRGEAEQFWQAGFRALGDRGMGNTLASNVGDHPSQSPAPVSQLSHQVSISNDISITSVDERPNLGHHASLDEQSYSAAGLNMLDYQSNLLPFPSTSSRSLGKLQTAKPRLETCQGCQGWFSWSAKATPYVVSSGLCRCESHLQQCVYFMDKYDAGKCTCCDGRMPFSDRATPFILPAFKIDTGPLIDENDFSDMMNWDASGL
ncbi:hypothetical protein A1O7_04808 [Cladophialophora yegresii CBS 114405]|uniref:Uncharacterized protein n=1 Tax=Cladophialophora yegresii CBS 114405 TaxID=1182544 RepID=W9W6N3_9EURO|nr:uncharacterized protein A1O7_04808 [Cladophialophora yegresii CBS 114405]EXJ60655.1 hypothetical protein A1O7_04808 [Cladophialophora yegresii CBS 114405]